MRLAVLLVAAFPALAQYDRASMNKPAEPFRIIGNIYSVGTAELGCFLIATPAGNILLDAGMPESAAQVASNIERLGFKLESVKLLLNSHGHYDHAGGLAELKRRTGAKLVVAEAEAPLLAAGGKGDFRFGDELPYPPATADRTVRDGDRVELGGTTLVANLTPGHTKGCTSWSLDFEEGGKKHRAVFVCSVSRLDYDLVHNQSYPGIERDFSASYRKLRELHPDVFLGSHASFFSMTAKRTRKGPENAFIDPAGYEKFIDAREKDFDEELARQRSAARR